MTYVMSDIHGDFDRSMKMLEEINLDDDKETLYAVTYKHLRAHETVLEIVCRLRLEKKRRKERLSWEER